MALATMANGLVLLEPLAHELVLLVCPCAGLAADCAGLSAGLDGVLELLARPACMLCEPVGGSRAHGHPQAPCTLEKIKRKETWLWALLALRQPGRDLALQVC